MSLKRLLWIGALVLIGTVPVSAQQTSLEQLNKQALEALPYGSGYEPCGQMQTTLAIAGCISEKTKVWDARLNDAYGRLRNRLADWGQDDQRTRLLDAQRAWIAYRDQNCGFYGHMEGTIAQIEAAECMRSMTATRAVELERVLTP